MTPATPGSDLTTLSIASRRFDKGIADRWEDDIREQSCTTTTCSRRLAVRLRFWNGARQCVFMSF